MIKQAVILCGGLGTRLLPITKKIPKPMAIVNGKPFLEHLIIQCRENGIKNFLLLCGYKKEIIETYFRKGDNLGVKIKYHFNPTKIETLKRLIDAKKYLHKKFLLLYSDNYSSLNLFDLEQNFLKAKLPMMLTVCKKKPGNIDINKDSYSVRNYFVKKNKLINFVDIGYMIIQKQVLDNFNENINISLSYLLKFYAKKNKIGYYLNDTNYLSISDPKRLTITKKYFSNKVILLDRDGVMNIKNNNHRYVRNLDELKINYKIIKKYFKILKDKKIICITNQAGIATGDVKNRDLIKINKKITQAYKKKKLNVFKFYISKHHFNSDHFDRKPRHGLFLKAANENKFILDKTVYIGDDLRDIEASYNAKTKCIYVGNMKIPKKALKKYAYTIKT